MSNKYKHGNEVPTKVLCKRLDELADAVTKGPKGYNEFTMRVPAELDRDADLVLSEAAIRLTNLDREVKVLRQYGNKDCTAMADEVLGNE